MSVCSSCGAQIFWAMTAAGKSMPLDRRPVENGNVILDENQIAEVISPTNRRALRGRKTFVSHFATCPNADQHRRTQDA